MGSIIRRRDVWAGLLMLVLGLGVVMQGRSLRMGTLTRMGPGYIPTALGMILAVLGLAIALTAAPAVPASDTPGHEAVAPPDWRGVLAIIAGIVGFLVLGAYGGLVPATFACVFVSALGDRAITLRAAVALAAAMTVLAVGLFHFALQVQFPLIIGWLS